MKTRRFIRFLMGCTLFIALGVTSYADDTEIFFANTSTNNTNPNVMFILDNSQSMEEVVGDVEDGGKTRLQTMKDSLAYVLGSASDINVSLMRLNGPGGSIMFPEAPIEEPYLYPTVTAVGDDAIEDTPFSVATDSGIVELDPEVLTIGSVVDGFITVTSSITRSEDDAQEDEKHSHEIDLYKTEMTFQDKSNRRYWNGLMFHNINVPKGARIIRAYITFTARYRDRGRVKYRVRGDLSETPLGFTTDARSVSDRTTTVGVNWRPSKWWAERTYDTSDLSSIVTEIVNQPGWDGTDRSMVFTFEWKSDAWFDKRRRSYTFDSDPARPELAPVLTIEYADLTPEKVMTGLHFHSVPVPQGVPIRKAYIKLVPIQSSTSSAGDIQITMEDSGDALEFEDIYRHNISDRPSVPGSVTWPIGDWVDDVAQETPDLKDLVQQVVNRPDWCGNNNMVFAFHETLTNTLFSRYADSNATASGLRPQLFIEYDNTNVTSANCYLYHLHYQIEHDHDDARQRNLMTNVDHGGPNDGERGQVNYRDGDLEIKNDHKIGLRFLDLQVKQDAEIADARIILTAKRPHGKEHLGVSDHLISGENNDADPNEITIWAETRANPPTFTEDRYNISNRNDTGGPNDSGNQSSNRGGSGDEPGDVDVIWDLKEGNPLEHWRFDREYSTPNLGAIVEAVVGLDDWSPTGSGTEGNDIVFMLQSFLADNLHNAYTHNVSPSASAKLVLKVSYENLSAELQALYADGPHTAGDQLVDSANSLNAYVRSPLVDALYEAALYFRGSAVDGGKKRYLDLVTDDDEDGRQFKRLSNDDSWSGGSHPLPAGCTLGNLDSMDCVTEELTGTPTYISPVVDDCQANYIVIISDGVTNSNGFLSEIETMMGESCSSTTNPDEECSEELATWLSTTDLAPSVPGVNTARIFTIAVDPEEVDGVAYLQLLAEKGKGASYIAESQHELSDAFTDTLEAIALVDTSFVAPGVSVDQSTRLNHGEDIYFSLFKPKTTPKWDGNLKKYKMASSGALQGQIVGIDEDSAAVHSVSGVFKDTTQSFWSASVDGNNVDLGGAASKFHPATRWPYIYPADGDTAIKNNTGSPNLDKYHATLQAYNILHAYNGAESWDMFHWLAGWDRKDVYGNRDNGGPRFQMGAMLHSAPVVVGYGGTTGSIVYITTNEGYLHAIDADDGTEVFSFLPEDALFDNKVFFDNSPVDEHPYGLDGQITPWVVDSNGDGIITSGDGDKVYIFFGMRRGGSKYYGMDVTDSADPKLIGILDGESSVGYSGMGQSWSQPTPARINIDGDIKEVLVIGGGYDTNQDDVTTLTSDTVGNSVYIIDAFKNNGADKPDLLWKGGSTIGDDKVFSDMFYGIPARINAIDVNGDGYTDQLYFGDMGGQLWRMDITQNQPASTLINGGVIADLSTAATAADTRRFYHTVDVAILARDGSRHLSVSVGSGWQAHPLDTTVNDRFYLIEQSIKAPSSYTTLSESDLYNATDNLLETGDATEISTETALLNSASGWYIEMEGAGEKVLSQSLTVKGSVIFTSYAPSSDLACGALRGTSKVYVVDAFDATSVLELDSLPGSDRYKVLKTGIIPPKPVLYIPKSGESKILIGTEVAFDVPINLSTKTYWTPVD